MKVIPQIIIENRNVFTIDQLFGIVEKIFYNIFNSSSENSEALTQHLNLIKFGEKFLCNLISSDLFEYDQNYRHKLLPLVFNQLEVFQQYSGLIIHHFNPMVYMVRFLENESYVNFIIEFILQII